MQAPTLQLDGPYVFATESGYRIIDTAKVGDDWQLRERMMASTSPCITVHVDNPAATVFTVAPRPAPPPAPAVVADNPSRLLMASDMEGEFDKFTALMRAQGVIDADLHWSYGNGHLVLVGDFVDRGQNVLPLLWLIYRLDDEAIKAGGGLHYVLGNHEQFALSGTPKYWPDRMIASAQAMGDHAETRMFGESSVLGAWLRSRPVMMKIGDHLFVHAGVSQAFLDTHLTIDAANTLARAHINQPLKQLPAQVQPVLGHNGLTWYRGMARPHDPEYALEADPDVHVQRVLQRYGVKRIAIAHTIVEHVMLEHDGKLLRLDVHHAEQVPEAALYENGVLWWVDANGGRKLLAGKP
ncbi:MAG TPA: metallophosphoesterase [Chiayiivirga sp.]|nr:metallophosphoesterase [Chiayiivirga sp.]